MATLRRVISGASPPKSISRDLLPQKDENIAPKQNVTLELKPHQVKAVKLLGKASLASNF